MIRKCLATSSSLRIPTLKLLQWPIFRRISVLLFTHDLFHDLDHQLRCRVALSAQLFNDLPLPLAQFCRVSVFAPRWVSHAIVTGIFGITSIHRPRDCSLVFACVKLANLISRIPAAPQPSSSPMPSRGSTPQALHQRTNSIGSTRRSPDSVF